MVFVVVSRRVWDSFVVDRIGVWREQRGQEGDGTLTSQLFQERWQPDCNTVTRRLDAYFAAHFAACLSQSEALRIGVIHNVHRTLKTHTARNGHMPVLVIRLRPPEKPMIDIKWGAMICMQIQELAELQHAMSWLSTLGGGFSALGDYHAQCAEVAGRISMGQLAIAHRLGDPILTCKCRLYAALSLIQLGRLKAARNIIRAQYSFARSRPEGSRDPVLIRMCLGIWSKLQYAWTVLARK